MKFTTTLLFLLLINSTLAIFTPTYAQVQKPQKKANVLIMMSDHVSKPKGKMLTELAKNQPFNLVNFNSKGKSENEIKIAWQSAKLIMLDGINPELSQLIFAKYESYLKDYPNVPVISLGDISNKKTNQGD